MTLAVHRQQRGVVLLLIMLVLLVSGSSLLLAAISTQSADQRQRQKLNRDLARAKEALLAFAVHAESLAAGGSPGQLPCPVDDDGTTVCTLPGHLPLDSPLLHGIDSEIRYQVASAFNLDSDVPLNTMTAADLTVDGEAGHVAVLRGAAPAGTADIQLAITCDELQALLVPRVMDTFQTLLTEAASLPADGPAFQSLVATQGPPWLVDNQWAADSVSSYALIDPDEGEVMITLSADDDCAPPVLEYRLSTSPEEAV